MKTEGFYRFNKCFIMVSQKNDAWTDKKLEIDMK